MNIEPDEPVELVKWPGSQACVCVSRGETTAEAGCKRD